MRTKPLILRDGDYEANRRLWWLKKAADDLTKVHEVFVRYNAAEEHAKDFQSLRGGIDRLWQER